MNTRHLFLLFASIMSCYGLQAATATNPPDKHETIMNNKDVLDLVSINFVITREKDSYDKDSWDRILRLVSSFIDECESTESRDNSLPSRIGNFSEDLLKIKGLGIHGDLNVDIGRQDEGKAVDINK